MKKALILIISFLILTIFISGCIQQESSSPAMLKIVNAKLESGSLLLSLGANQSVEKVRVELVSEDGQVLCTKYKDLVQGLTEFELRDCEVRKKVTVSVSPPGGTMITKDFQFELPSVRIKNTRFESGNMIATLDADELTKNVRIDIIDESDTILCSKYNDLVKGTSEIELTDCEIRERITVAVSPPKAEMITRDFTLTLPEVRIKSVKSELAKLILSLDANMGINNVKIYVFSKDGEVLCTATKNLAKGLSEHELNNCQVQNEISVSVSSPHGKTNVKDFTLELPLPELKQGMKYIYISNNPQEIIDLDIYVTKETDKEWEGILTYKKEQPKRIWLLRFKLDKKNLGLLATYPLGENEILSEEMQYIGLNENTGLHEINGVMLPFILSMLKEMSDYDINQFIKTGSVKLRGSGGPGPSQMSLSKPVIKGNWLAYEVTFKPEGGTEQEVKFFISVAKPYLLIEISAAPDVPNFILEKVESKKFDLSEYKGYEIQVKEIQHLDSFCEPSGVAGAVIKNTGRKPIYTSKIEVMQVKPSDTSVSVTWDKQVIQPGENAIFRDQCEESDDWHCLYQITSPGGNVIHISMDCGELLK